MKVIIKLIFDHPIESATLSMKDLVILTLNKAACLNMAKVENDLDIDYAVRNVNNQKQENEIETIMKKVILQHGS